MDAMDAMDAFFSLSALSSMQATVLTPTAVFAMSRLLLVHCHTQASCKAYTPPIIVQCDPNGRSTAQSALAVKSRNGRLH